MIFLQVAVENTIPAFLEEVHRALIPVNQWMGFSSAGQKLATHFGLSRFLGLELLRVKQRAKAAEVPS